MAEPLPITYPGFEGRGLALRPSGWIKGAAIVTADAAPTRKGRTFTVSDNAGAPVVFQLKGNILDPIPAVVVGDQTIRLARPLAWYEYVWIALPLVLLVGGALGGACGGAAMLVNARILRSNEPVWVRYALGVLVMIAAVIALFLLGALLSLAVGLPSQ